MTAPVDPNRFEEAYRDERTAHGLPAATPWDIGGPQPVVQQLVALGVIKGEVLDPGTAPATMLAGCDRTRPAGRVRRT